MKPIRYPAHKAPEPGHCEEIAAGILWLRMPLPMALNHINLYLLRDGEGWMIIDTGMGGESIRNIWLDVFDQYLNSKPVTRVLCTHMHPDHIGQAGWLSEYWNVPLLMTSGEYFAARTFSAPAPSSSNWEMDLHFTSIGFNPEELHQRRQSASSFSSLVEPMPKVFHRLQDHQGLSINNENWVVMTGEGHSPEHACLFNTDRRILISGDQILPGISSNVSVTSTEPEANPLKGWLASIEKFEQLPPDTLILPAHNKPFYGLHHRLQQLATHHEEQTSKILQACQQPTSAKALLPILFKRQLDPTQSMMAIGETVAHLNYMVYKNLLNISYDKTGARLYTASGNERLDLKAFHEY